MKPSKIAFLGTGLMGTPMARRLLQAGLSVTVWNRTPARAARCVSAGAVLADSVQEAVREADLVITMLEAGPVVLDVVGQALPGLQPGTLLIDMSSTRQSEAFRLHTLLTRHGVAFIDAPVSGGVIGAESGSLAIMAGALQADFDRAVPVLSVFGTPRRVGGPGSGQLAKLCNQLIVGGTLHLVAEALLLAEAGGADPAAVREALQGGFAASKILEVHGQRMLERNFMPGGQVKSQAKDMENVLDLAGDLGLELPQARLITAVYRRLMQSDREADQSAALLDLERANPGFRLGAAPDQKP